jgi:hypothetical protein
MSCLSDAIFRVTYLDIVNKGRERGLAGARKVSMTHFAHVRATMERIPPRSKRSYKQIQANWPYGENFDNVYKHHQRSTFTSFPWWWRRRWSPKRRGSVHNWHGFFPEKVLSTSFAVKAPSLTRYKSACFIRIYQVGCLSPTDWIEKINTIQIYNCVRIQNTLILPAKFVLYISVSQAFWYPGPPPQNYLIYFD